jgi:hypothetical protein
MPMADVKNVLESLRYDIESAYVSLKKHNPNLSTNEIINHLQAMFDSFLKNRRAFIMRRYSAGYYHELRKGIDGIIEEIRKRYLESTSGTLQTKPEPINRSFLESMEKRFNMEDSNT